MKQKPKKDRYLKPCPFCGNAFPVIRPSAVCVSLSIIKIYCPTCDTYFMLGSHGGNEYSEEKTVAAWNRRAEKEEN